MVVVVGVGAEGEASRLRGLKRATDFRDDISSVRSGSVIFRTLDGGRLRELIQPSRRIVQHYMGTPKPTRHGNTYVSDKLRELRL
ncbi:hypothetical protein M8818_002152 [Zalaria obscura]|uniref:Uncharacterized protein n=1 Tax=Zalaria obscura TaxID=2024903 RepID=A0ACC3SI11_9PEZI